MKIRAQPAKGAWDVILGNLCRLKEGEKRDFGTVLLTCQGTQLDQARFALAQNIWDHCALSDLPESVKSQEVRCRLKHGSKSNEAGWFEGPAVLHNNAMRFFRTHHTHINECSAAYATIRLRSWLKKGSLRSTSLVDAAVMLSRKKAAGGWPFMLTCTQVPYEYFEEAQSIELDGLDLSDAWEYPGQPYVRGDSAGPGKRAKPRVIYGFSLVINLLKRKLLTPVFNKLVKRPMFSANLSREAVDRAVTGILKRARGRNILSIDFENFDARVPNRVIDECFGALGYWYSEGDQALVRWAKEAFQRTGLMIPSRRGEFDYLPGCDRMGGVPSGSVLTNLINNMANYWAITYVAHRLGIYVEECLLQGDDGVYLFSGDWKISDLSEVLLVELGMLLSPTKSLVSPRIVHFLQMVHDLDMMGPSGLCPGMRMIMRLVNSMGSLERAPGDNLLYDSLRWLSQVDNASAHPRYRQLLRWLADHDTWLPELLARALQKEPSISAMARAILGDGAYSANFCENLYKMPSVRLLSDHFAGVCTL